MIFKTETGHQHFIQPTIVFHTYILIGAIVSVMFCLMFVYIIFSSVVIAEWPPFRKELLTRLTICSLFFDFVVLVI